MSRRAVAMQTWYWMERRGPQESRRSGTSRILPPMSNRVSERGCCLPPSSAIFEVLVIPTRRPQATPKEGIRPQFLGEIGVLGEHAGSIGSAVDVRRAVLGPPLTMNVPIRVLHGIDIDRRTVRMRRQLVWVS